MSDETTRDEALDEPLEIIRDYAFPGGRVPRDVALKRFAWDWAEVGPSADLAKHPEFVRFALHELTGGRLGEMPTLEEGEPHARVARRLGHMVGRALAPKLLAETGTAAAALAARLASAAAAEDSPGGAVDSQWLVEWLIARMGPEAAPALFPYVTVAVVDRARVDAEARAARAEEQLAVSNRETPRRPTLRQGMGLLRSWLKTEDDVQGARRRVQTRGFALDTADVDARKLFVYEPLGWAERLVIHGLATLARDQGLLDAHPWAVSLKPLAEHPAPRVRIDFPGFSELAHLLGYEAGPDGKIPRATRETLERALRSLCTDARWIATPVLLRVGGKRGRRHGEPGGGELIEDIEVRQTLWVEAAASTVTRGVYLDLHPAAITSHIKAFVDVPALGLKYQEACKKLGARQMRDEWAVADDYLRYLAIAAAAGARRRREQRGEDQTAVGDLVIEKRIAFETAVDRLGLATFARKQGKPAARRRVEEAWRFCVELGSLESFAESADGQYDLVLPHPDRRVADQTQLLLLLAPEEEAP